MTPSKADIIAKLRQDILPLQGFKPMKAGAVAFPGLGPINEAFPNACFPLGAVHEFITGTHEDGAASAGFIAGVISGLMKNGGASIWIGRKRTLYPPALRSFGITPDHFIFVDLDREKDIQWAMDEALKCEGLAAVMGEMQDLSFTASRRLQLAVEKSRVTGFILRNNVRKINTTACVTRWKISPMASDAGDMPGVGFPRWKVDLLKVRNGKPGSWEIEWNAGGFGVVMPGTMDQQKVAEIYPFRSVKLNVG